MNRLRSVFSLFVLISSLIFSIQIASAQGERQTVLITGSSKGHGFAFVKDYAALGWNVIATCRNPETSDRLTAFAARHDNVVVEELDLTDFSGIDALAAKYGGTAIDVLNLNGAINTFRFSPNKFGQIDYTWFEEILRVNVVGQLYTAEAFLDHVASSNQKKIVAMSAVGGSIGNVRSETAPSYRASKSALNMLFRTYGEAVKERDVAVLVIAPGTVDAEDYMNTENPSMVPAQFQRMIEVGALEPRSTIGEIIELIDRLTIEDIDQFHKFDGTSLPW